MASALRHPSSARARRAVSGARLATPAPSTRLEHPERDSDAREVRPARGARSAPALSPRQWASLRQVKAPRDCTGESPSPVRRWQPERSRQRRSGVPGLLLLLLLAEGGGASAGAKTGAGASLSSSSSCCAEEEEEGAAEGGAGEESEVVVASSSPSSTMTMTEAAAAPPPTLPPLSASSAPSLSPSHPLSDSVTSFSILPRAGRGSPGSLVMLRHPCRSSSVSKRSADREASPSRVTCQHSRRDRQRSEVSVPRAAKPGAATL